MGLGSVISSIMFLVLAYIIKDIEQSKVCLDYSVFFAGIAFICFAIEKNKS